MYYYAVNLMGYHNGSENPLVIRVCVRVRVLGELTEEVVYCYQNCNVIYILFFFCSNYKHQDYTIKERKLTQR
jgi:hypothetical protein